MSKWRCTGCGSASDEQHPADCPEYLKSLGNIERQPPHLLADHWRREAERLKVRGDELEARLAEVLGPELPDLGVELRRLEALVQAYQAMPTDAERRRAMNYLRDRFPGPTVMRGAPGGSIVVNETGRRDV